MNDLRMILADGTEIMLSEFILPMHIVVLCETRADVMELWNRLIDENLVSVKVLMDGTEILAFAHAYVDGLQCVYNGDGSMTVHFYLMGEHVEPNAHADAEQGGKE